jgi:hypothetical protein
MDKGLLAQYHAFLTNPAGNDLIDRLKITEAKYQMEGMQAATIELKGMSMAKIEATYAIRTMLDDLSKPVQSQSKSSAGSK